VSAGGLDLLAALDALRFLLPPVDAWLKERGREGATLLRAHAERLDARVRSGAQLEDSVLLATLLLPLLRSPPAPGSRPQAPGGGEGGPPPQGEGEEPGPSVPPAVEDLLQELVRTARLPRRIAERCRMILLAQATLSGQRRRRGGLASFRRHPLFQEALTVFELSVEATGEHREALEAWRSGGAPSPPSGGPPAEGGRRRRRRRRRGPRSGQPPGGGGGGPGT
jgi:poly(A) polymerase